MKELVFGIVLLLLSVTVSFQQVQIYKINTTLEVTRIELELADISYNRKLETVIDGNNAVTDALEERIGFLEHTVEDLQFMRGKK